MNKMLAIRYLYVFVLNGAALKTHDTQDGAMRQARQWKAKRLDSVVTVEEIYHDGDMYVRTRRDVTIEIPMLVPSLTPRHDFDSAPYDG